MSLKAWTNRIFTRPTLPVQPLALRLESGPYYIILFDRKLISKSAVESIMINLNRDNIRAEAVLVDDPVAGITYLEFKRSTQAPEPTGSSLTPQTT